MELIPWLESSRIAIFVRESNSLLAYPTILFTHTLGLAAVAGFSTLLNLRVLGFARALPLAALRPFIPAIWVGFAMTVASGLALLLTDVATRMRTPVFYIKLIFVALALVNLHLLTKRVFNNPLAERSPLPRQAHVLAASSLLFWAGATTAGRLMAYMGPIG